MEGGEDGFVVVDRVALFGRSGSRFGWRSEMMSNLVVAVPPVDLRRVPGKKKKEKEKEKK